MRFGLKALFSLVLLAFCTVARADTFSGGVAFLDVSNPINNAIGFTGAFASPIFAFSGTSGVLYKDALTIAPVDFNFLSSQSGTDALSISIGFLFPSIEGGAINGSGTISGLYNRLNGSLSWANGGNTLFTFANGTQLLASIPNYTFTGPSSVTHDLTFSAVAATPEPSSMMLLGTGVLAAAGVARRKWRTVTA